MVGIKHQVEGYWNVVPKVRTISFPASDQLKVELEDGRIIIMPLNRFPSILNLTSEQRKHWYTYGNGFSFDDADEVIHIEQILGNLIYINTKHKTHFVYDYSLCYTCRCARPSGDLCALHNGFVYVI